VRFSIIIPSLNESARIGQTLDNVFSSIDTNDIEVLLSDGGSTDATLDIARQYPLKAVSGTPGRAIQMNRAAQRASGDWLVFLHADTSLPTNWMTSISDCDSQWGRSDVRLSGSQWLLRMVETSMNLRSCLTSVATGDQAMFFRRPFFEELGGFPPLPLMEDIAISKQARKQHKPACIKHPVITSSQRWEKNGIVKTILTMWYLRLAYWSGVKAEKLHKLYYS
jgi:rSAM/selenodomain-associated transferase 2